MRFNFFRILLGFDLVICAAVLIFFLVGLADGSITSFNVSIWLAIITVMAVLLGGGVWLKRNAYPILGHWLLLVLAGPGLIYGLFLILTLVTNTKWN